MKIPAIFLLFPVLFIAGPVFAQNAIPHDVAAGGGGESNDGSYYLHDTIAQTVQGITSSASNIEKIGYWYSVDNMHIGPTSEVLITVFEAELTDEGVMLGWELGRWEELKGFNVYRASGEQAVFEKLNDEIIPAGEARNFTDNGILPDHTYYYKMSAVDKDGEFFSPTRKLYVPPGETELYQNYPNPFNPRTIVSFFVPSLQQVQIVIFDIQGRRVRSLANDVYAYGKHKLEWNGKNDRGEQVGSGVYFYRMKAGKRIFTKKLTLLK